ncbi:amino acid adenylation domain-containing protein [Mycobacterium sp. NPDC048908]|uniref:amino acid adenylation domain-containing protein n=1 Tax=Mycobacterium sp. NPDC048908 TaxID=3364292 RepID=UPI00371E5E32
MALSPLQQGLYSMAVLSDHDPYVIAMAADITGRLDAGLLRDCAATMLARHPNLRASFLRGNLNRPVQVVPVRADVPWRHVTATADEVAAFDADERGRPFDLERGPAIRFLLIEVPRSHWRFVVVAHHIIIDGWSLPLFVGELIALYRFCGDTSALPPPPRPYRDYIGWLARRDQRTSRALWRDHLSGIDGPTLLTPALTAGELPVGPPHRTEVKLDAEDTERLVQAARARGVTVNALVQLAWATILSTITDRDDVIFGVTVSGRPGELSGVETMVGLFINTVPLRVRLDPAERVGVQCVALQRDAALLRDHSYLSHAELRSLAGVGEMFDTLLVYENFPPGGLVGGGEFTANGATFRPAALESLSHFPVTVAAHLIDGRLAVLIEAIDGALGLMTPQSLGRRLLTTMRRLMHGWDAPLRDISILLDDDDGETAVAAAAPGSGGVHTRFTEIAATRPASVALTWSGGRYTYRELDQASDRVAAALVARGVRPEAPVAINLTRGPEYVAAMFGVLKAGAVIVPLDPGMPAERIAGIIAQTNATVIDDGFGTAQQARDVPDFRAATVDPAQAAYVVFTSGTTGTPKGVIGTHQALLAYAADHARNVLRPTAARLCRPIRVAHAWSFTFDAAWQPLAALLDGHTVHIVDDDTLRDAEALVDTIAGGGIDMIDTTPSMFTQLHAVGLLTTVPLAVLALGGEAVGTAAWNLIHDETARTGMKAYNCYGPTESTVEATVAAIADHAAPTIGVPTTPSRAYVLDSWLRPVPVGVPGELYLAGRQLTRGYLGRPAETACRFVADPFVAGERMYRTGDVVRRQQDRALQFLGRSDAQVKIRGFRVEPAEISAVLHAHPAVRHAHVLVKRHGNAARLTAYVAAAPAPDVAELCAMLSKRLPRYMVPHHIVVIDEMPLTPHGKVDEAALAASAAAVDVPTARPETPTETALAELTAEILQTDHIDVAADLVRQGLDSIVALSVVQAARQRGIPLRARLLLECGTIRELAAAVDSESVSVGRVDGGGGPITLLSNARWLYEFGDARRLAQTHAIRLPDGITGGQLKTLLQNVVAGHRVLRSRLDRDSITLVEHDVTVAITEVAAAGDLVAAVAAETKKSVDRIDPEKGVLIDAVWLREEGVLVLTAHVLAMDPASWRIVLGELDAGWRALADGRAPAVAREHTSHRRWSQLLCERAGRLDSCDFWVAQLEGDDPDLGARRVRPDTDRVGDVTVTMCAADPEVTARLSTAAQPITRLLVSAAARMVENWRRHRGQQHAVPLLAIETHGRADGIAADADTSDTVGLLSAVYPLRIHAPTVFDDIPGDGIDYGLLRYLRPDTAERLRAHREPQLLLNFLGRLSFGVGRGGMRLDHGLLAEVSTLPEPLVAVRHELTIIAAIVGDADAPVLATQWRTLPDILSADDVATLQAMWEDALREVAQ